MKNRLKPSLFLLLLSCTFNLLYFDVPMHPGAEKDYREAGYMRNPRYI